MATKREKELQNMNNGELIRAFQSIITTSIRESNSARGITKKTAKNEEVVIKEMARRFDFDADILKPI